MSGFLGRIILLVGTVYFFVFGLVYAQEINPQTYFYSTFGIVEGDVIGSQDPNDPDIFIANEHGYKRLFLNPIIFSLYGHLNGGYSNVKRLPPDVFFLFPISGLFRNCETKEQKVYALETVSEDGGILHWVNISGTVAVSEDANFFKKVFCINTAEFNIYAKGGDYVSLSQIPSYLRSIPSFGEPPVVSADSLKSFKIPFDNSTWKTYTNSKYGFSVRYPDVWAEQELGGEGIFLGDVTGTGSGVPPDVSVSMGENPNNLSPQNFLGQLLTGSGNYSFEINGTMGHVVKSDYGYALAVPVGNRMLTVSAMTQAGMANFDDIIITLQVSGN